MRVILLGASGMVGQGVLRECRRDPATARSTREGGLDRAVHAASGALLSLAARQLPRYMTSSAQLGRAMIRVVCEAGPSRMLESADINRL